MTLGSAYASVEAMPKGGYGLIMADPPWTFRTFSAKGRGKSPGYVCQDLDWVKSLPVADLAARDCLLWLWATNPMLPQAIEVMGAWGFTFKTAGHWSKKTRHGAQAFGTGYLLRCAGEPFLIGTRGKPKTARTVRSVIEGQIREHSRKPDEAFAAAERLMPDVARCELFARQRRTARAIIDAYDAEPVLTACTVLVMEWHGPCPPVYPYPLQYDMDLPEAFDEILIRDMVARIRYEEIEGEIDDGDALCREDIAAMTAGILPMLVYPRVAHIADYRD